MDVDRLLFLLESLVCRLFDMIICRLKCSVCRNEGKVVLHLVLYRDIFVSMMISMSYYEKLSLFLISKRI